MYDTENCVDCKHTRFHSLPYNLVRCWIILTEILYTNILHNYLYYLYRWMKYFTYKIKDPFMHFVAHYD